MGGQGAGDGGCLLQSGVGELAAQRLLAEREQQRQRRRRVVAGSRDAAVVRRRRRQWRLRCARLRPASPGRLRRPLCGSRHLTMTRASAHRFRPPVHPWRGQRRNVCRGLPMNSLAAPANGRCGLPAVNVQDWAPALYKKACRRDPLRREQQRVDCIRTQVCMKRGRCTILALLRGSLLSHSTRHAPVESIGGQGLPPSINTSGHAPSLPRRPVRRFLARRVVEDRLALMTGRKGCQHRRKILNAASTAAKPAQPRRCSGAQSLTQAVAWLDCRHISSR